MKYRRKYIYVDAFQYTGLKNGTGCWPEWGKEALKSGALAIMSTNMIPDIPILVYSGVDCNGKSTGLHKVDFGMYIVKDEFNHILILSQYMFNMLYEET